MHTEIELRYKINDIEQTLAALLQCGAAPQDEQHIVDKWFIPETIGSREQHDEWFDHQHGVAYRIRTILSPGGKAVERVLDSKQHTDANNHNTFAEEVVLKGDEPAMQTFLAQKGYYNWLTIDKKRRRFHSPRPDLLIVMDSVAGVKDALGVDTVLELEYNGDAARGEALTIINDFAKTLGLEPNTQFEKSLTVEAMRVLARFSQAAV